MRRLAEQAGLPEQVGLVGPAEWAALLGRVGLLWLDALTSRTI
jgi:hypothetical protein